MAEFKRPAVYVRDVASVPPPPAAAPSALGLVGYTLKGPSNKAFLVESFDDFNARFGGFTQLSLVPLMLEKYFSNGGQIAYIVRVTPVGSIKAENPFLGDILYSNGIETGDGTTMLFSGFVPNAPLAKAKLAASMQGNGGVGPYTFTIPGGFKPHSLGIVAGAQYAIDEENGYPVGTLVGADVAAGTVGYTSGAISVTFLAPVSAGVTIEVYVNVLQIRALDSTGAPIIAFDDGAGGLVGNVNSIGPNIINYLTGEYTVNFTSAPGGSTTVRVRNDNVGTVGNVAITKTVAAGGFLIAGMLGGTAYKPATGSLVAVAGALLIDGETFTIGDGVNPATVFEFDSNGVVVAGHVAVVFTGAYTDIQVANSMRAAINAAANLNVSAEPVFAYDTRDRWLFTAQSEGVWGNDIRIAVDGTPNSRKQERDGDITPFLALGTGVLNATYSFVIPNAPLIPNTIMITAFDKMVYDDGNNNLIGDVFSSSSIDYQTGAVSVTFAGTIPLGAIIRANQNGFQYFDISVEELQTDTQEYLVQEVFEALNFTDPNSTDFVTTVMNDAAQGSDYVDTVVGQGGVIPSLIREANKDTIGTGDGTTRRFQATLAYPPVDPFSVKVVVTNPAQEAVDDGVGVLTGANVDPFGVNTINYATGQIDVTFKQPPAVGVAVKVIYVKLLTEATLDLEGGSDGTGIISSGQIADPSLEAQKAGVYAFNAVEGALNVVVPDFAESSVVLQDLINYAEAKKDRFIIGTTASNLTPSEAANFRRTDIRSNSSFVGIYYPWVKALDRSINKVRTIPPMGHVAGVYSRVDRSRSEGKSPAGISDGLLLDVVGLERILEAQDVEIVFPVNINSIIQSANIGIFINGARTLSSDKDFKYVSTRRVFIAIRKRAEADLRFALFEPIGPALYSQINGALTSIALEYFQKGALAGSNPREAFEVLVEEINTAALAEQGIVKARLAIAPTKPAEFIVVELTIKQKDSTVVLA
jgi:hypothetical protein